METPGSANAARAASMIRMRLRSASALRDGLWEVEWAIV
jgi:hypothetical protein